MPQVTVYIREDDLDKWKALEKKSEFLHNALNPSPLKQIRPDALGQFAKPIKTLKDMPGIHGASVVEVEPMFSAPDVIKSPSDQEVITSERATSNIIRSPKDAEKAVQKIIIPRKRMG